MNSSSPFSPTPMWMINQAQKEIYKFCVEKDNGFGGVSYDELEQLLEQKGLVHKQIDKEMDQISIGVVTYSNNPKSINVIVWISDNMVLAKSVPKLTNSGTLSYFSMFLDMIVKDCLLSPNSTVKEDDDYYTKKIIDHHFKNHNKLLLGLPITVKSYHSLQHLSKPHYFPVVLVSTEQLKIRGRMFNR